MTEPLEVGPESETQPTLTRPRAWLAGLLSFLLPGLGHLYLGLVRHAVLAWVLVIILWKLAEVVVIYADWGASALAISVILYLGGPIYFIIDSVRRARSMAHRQKTLPALIFVLLFVAWWAFDWFLPTGLSKFSAYKVPVTSMENALQVGDYFLADRSAYQFDAPHRGDVIVFVFPGDLKTLYVKRCVGMPGDTILVVDKKLHVNGLPEIPHPTLKYIDDSIEARADNGRNSRDNFGPFVVPAGSYFIMGDNRDNSYDSRFWGAVPSENVLARAVRIHWSTQLNRIGKAIN